LFERTRRMVCERRRFVADLWNSGTASNGCIAAGRPVLEADSPVAGRIRLRAVVAAKVAADDRFGRPIPTLMQGLCPSTSAHAAGVGDGENQGLLEPRAASRAARTGATLMAVL